MSYAALVQKMYSLVDQLVRIEDADRSAALEKLVVEIESKIREAKGGKA